MILHFCLTVWLHSEPLDRYEIFNLFATHKLMLHGVTQSIIVTDFFLTFRIYEVKKDNKML
jgi:hypothetical protein